MNNRVMHDNRNCNNERILFAKTPYQNKEAAHKALEERHLAPGELAAVRYFISNDAKNWNSANGMPTRMLIGCGGIDPFTGKDVFIFEDNGSYFEFVDNNGNNKEFNGVDEVISFILSNLNNSSSIDVNNYYTKNEIDDLINELKNTEIDTSIFATKEEVNNYINEVTNLVDTKADKVYVENYFEENVENTVNQIIEDANIPTIVEEEIEKQNISQKVSEEVDKKLENFEGVTTESIDDVLQNNEYFTTNVITPIETITEQVKTIENQIKNLDADMDGGEEEEWELEK